MCSAVLDLANKNWLLVFKQLSKIVIYVRIIIIIITIIIIIINESYFIDRDLEKKGMYACLFYFEGAAPEVLLLQLFAGGNRTANPEVNVIKGRKQRIRVRRALGLTSAFYT